MKNRMSKMRWKERTGDALAYPKLAAGELSGSDVSLE